MRGFEFETPGLDVLGRIVPEVFQTNLIIRKLIPHLSLLRHQTGVDFINILRAAFTQKIPKVQKKIDGVTL